MYTYEYWEWDAVLASQQRRYRKQIRDQAESEDLAETLCELTARFAPATQTEIL